MQRGHLDTFKVDLEREGRVSIRCQVFTDMNAEVRVGLRRSQPKVRHASFMTAPLDIVFITCSPRNRFVVLATSGAEGGRWQGQRPAFF